MREQYKSFGVLQELWKEKFNIYISSSQTPENLGSFLSEETIKLIISGINETSDHILSSIAKSFSFLNNANRTTNVIHFLPNSIVSNWGNSCTIVGSLSDYLFNKLLESSKQVAFNNGRGSYLVRETFSLVAFVLKGVVESVMEKTPELGCSFTKEENDAIAYSISLREFEQVCYHCFKHSISLKNVQPKFEPEVGVKVIRLLTERIKTGEGCGPVISYLTTLAKTGKKSLEVFLTDSLNQVIQPEPPRGSFIMNKSLVFGELMRVCMNEVIEETKTVVPVGKGTPTRATGWYGESPMPNTDSSPIDATVAEGPDFSSGSGMFTKDSEKVFKRVQESHNKAVTETMVLEKTMLFLSSLMESKICITKSDVLQALYGVGSKKLTESYSALEVFIKHYVGLEDDKLKSPERLLKLLQSGDAGDIYRAVNEVINECSRNYKVAKAKMELLEQLLAAS